MKKIIALALLAASQAIGGETKTISLQWDHDGVNALGFKVYSRQATNAPFTLAGTAGPTNRVTSITVTNPSPQLEIVMSTTNAYMESDLSNPVFLSKPSSPGALRVVSIVTVQTP